MLFSIGSTGGVKYQFSTTRPYDVGVAPIPHAENKDAKVISQGPSLGFMKRGASKEIMETRAVGTWLFYKEWSNTKFATEWATTGYSPLRDSVASSQAYIDYASTSGKQPSTLPIIYARTSQYVPTVGEALFTSPVFVGSSKARTGCEGILADIFKSVKAETIIDSPEFENIVNQKFESGYNNAI